MSWHIYLYTNHYPSVRKIICPAKFSSLVVLYTTKFYKQTKLDNLIFVCNEPQLTCCLPPERGLHTSPVEERHHMCLSCAQGLEGCFGEHISSMEDTFFGVGCEATRCRQIPADGTSFDLLSTDMWKPSFLIPSVLCMGVGLA